MKIDQLIKSSLLNKQLKNSLGYFAAGKVTSVYSDANNFKPWLFIVSRKHYAITHISYPALSLAELKSLLKISAEDKTGIKPIVDIKANKEIDGFDVRKITFDDKYSEELSQAWVLIPETEILAQQAINKTLYELYTPSGLLFFSQSDITSHSAYCGGLIPNSSIYKHSIGLADNVAVNEVISEQYFCFLAKHFKELNIAKFFKIIALNQSNKITSVQLHALYWGPLLSITLYLAVAAGWQWFSINQVEQKIASQSGSANLLLAQKQQLDTLNDKVILFNQRIAKSPTVLSDWEIINAALKTGMAISRFSSRQEEIILIGESQSANTTIREISKLPQVKSAIFKNGVRKSRSSERFEIGITLNPASHSGVNN